MARWASLIHPSQTPSLPRRSCSDQTPKSCFHELRKRPRFSNNTQPPSIPRKRCCESWLPFPFKWPPNITTQSQRRHPARWREHFPTPPPLPRFAAPNCAAELQPGLQLGFRLRPSVFCASGDGVLTASSFGYVCENINRPAVGISPRRMAGVRLYDEKRFSVGTPISAVGRKISAHERTR
jgi:hypothetical protein